MKKILAIILSAGFILSAVPSESESARPVGKFRCVNCGAVVEIPYDYNTNTIPHPSKAGYAKGCKRSPIGEHKWRAMGAKFR